MTISEPKGKTSVRDDVWERSHQLTTPVSSAQGHIVRRRPVPLQSRRTGLESPAPQQGFLFARFLKLTSVWGIDRSAGWCGSAWRWATNMTDWRLWACIAVGILAMLMLPPPITSFLDGSYVFDGRHLFGIVVLLVRATLGTVLGVCAYLVFVEVPNSTSEGE
jgi:hypothetical protein